MRQDLVGLQEVREPLDRLDLLEIRDHLVRLAHRVQSEIQVNKGQQVHPVPTDLSGQMDCQDRMVHQDHKAQPVQTDPLAQADRPVLKATPDFRELVEQQVHRDFLGSRELQDRKDLVEQTGSRELKDKPVHRELLGTQAHPDLMELQAILDQLVCRE